MGFFKKIYRKFVPKKNNKPKKNKPKNNKPKYNKPKNNYGIRSNPSNFKRSNGKYMGGNTANRKAFANEIKGYAKKVHEHNKEAEKWQKEIEDDLLDGNKVFQTVSGITEGFKDVAIPFRPESHKTGSKDAKGKDTKTYKVSNFAGKMAGYVSPRSITNGVGEKTVGKFIDKAAKTKTVKRLGEKAVKNKLLRAMSHSALKKTGEKATKKAISENIGKGFRKSATGLVDEIAKDGLANFNMATNSGKSIKDPEFHKELLKTNAMDLGFTVLPSAIKVGKGFKYGKHLDKYREYAKSDVVQKQIKKQLEKQGYTLHFNAPEKVKHKAMKKAFKEVGKVNPNAVNDILARVDRKGVETTSDLVDKLLQDRILDKRTFNQMKNYEKAVADGKITQPLKDLRPKGKYQVTDDINFNLNNRLRTQFDEILKYKKNQRQEEIIKNNGKVPFKPLQDSIDDVKHRMAVNDNVENIFKKNAIKEHEKGTYNKYLEDLASGPDTKFSVLQKKLAKKIENVKKTDTDVFLDDEYGANLANTNKTTRLGRLPKAKVIREETTDALQGAQISPDRAMPIPREIRLETEKNLKDMTKLIQAGDDEGAQLIARRAAEVVDDIDTDMYNEIDPDAEEFLEYVRTTRFHVSSKGEKQILLDNHPNLKGRLNVGAKSMKDYGKYATSDKKPVSADMIYEEASSLFPRYVDGSLIDSSAEDQLDAIARGVERALAERDSSVGIPDEWIEAAKDSLANDLMEKATKLARLNKVRKGITEEEFLERSFKGIKPRKEIKPLSKKATKKAAKKAVKEPIAEKIAKELPIENIAKQSDEVVSGKTLIMPLKENKAYKTGLKPKVDIDPLSKSKPMYAKDGRRIYTKDDIDELLKQENLKFEKEKAIKNAEYEKKMAEESAKLDKDLDETLKKYKTPKERQPIVDPELKKGNTLDDVSDYGRRTDNPEKTFDNSYRETPERNPEFRDVYDKVTHTKSRGTYLKSDKISQESKMAIKKSQRFVKTTVKNSDELKKASDYIERNGVDRTLDEFKNIISDGRATNSSDIARGAALVDELEKAGRYEDVEEVLATISVLQSEAARNLQAQKLFARNTPRGRVLSVKKQIDKQIIMNQLPKDYKPSEELIRNLYEAESQKDIFEASEAIARDIWSNIPPTVMEKLDSWRYLAMLGNPKTHIRNILGNVVNTSMHEVKNIVQTGMEKYAVHRGYISQADRTTTLSSRAIDKDLYKLANAHYSDSRYLMSGGGKNVIGRRPEGVSVFKSKVMRLAEKYNMSWLDKEDLAFSKFGYENAYVRYLKSKGITADDIAKGGDEIEMLLQEANDKAMDEALEITFRADNVISSWIAQSKRYAATPLSQIPDDKTSGKILKKAVGTTVGAVMPFNKTPINIANTAIKHSPAGIIGGVAKLGMAKSPKELTDGIKLLSEGLTGSAIMGLGYYAAVRGSVVGTMDRNDPEDRAKMLKGIQEYSVTLGNRNMSINELAPVSIPFFMGVEIGSEVGNGKIDFESGLNAISHMGDPLIEMTILSGINQTFDTSFASTSNLTRVGANIATGYGSQFVPTLFSQAARTIQPEVKTTTSTAETPSGRFVGKYINKQKAKLPFVSNTLPAYVNDFGEKETKETKGDYAKSFLENFIIPLRTKEVRDDKVTNEITKLVNELDDETAKSVLPRKTTTYGVKFEDKELRMSPEELSKYKEVRGTYYKKELEKLVTSSKYQDMSSEEKAKAISKISDKGTKLAKRDYLKSQGYKGYEIDFSEYSKSVKEKYESSGLDKQTFVKVHKATKGSGKQISKAMNAVNAGLDYEDVAKVTSISEKTYERAKALNELGFTAKDIDKIAKSADTDKSGGIKKTEALAYLETRTDLSDEEKQALFAVLCPQAKSMYSSRGGRKGGRKGRRSGRRGRRGGSRSRKSTVVVQKKTGGKIGDNPLEELAQANVAGNRGASIPKADMKYLTPEQRRVLLDALRG